MFSHLGVNTMRKEKKNRAGQEACKSRLSERTESEQHGEVLFPVCWTYGLSSGLRPGVTRSVLWSDSLLECESWRRVKRELLGISVRTGPRSKTRCRSSSSSAVSVTLLASTILPSPGRPLSCNAVAAVATAAAARTQCYILDMGLYSLVMQSEL